MWDAIFCLIFVVILLLWLGLRGASVHSPTAGFSYSGGSTVSNESEGISLDPTDISEPANMAMWMELGEL